MNLKVSKWAIILYFVILIDVSWPVLMNRLDLNSLKGRNT
ncbi:hypothetical protein IFVP177_C270162 [Vibrio parahaemolyticus]